MDLALFRMPELIMNLSAGADERVPKFWSLFGYQDEVSKPQSRQKLADCHKRLIALTPHQQSAHAQRLKMDTLG
jgi:hypothetical protein